MSTLAVQVYPQAQDVTFDKDSLTVVLLNGRSVSAPLLWFPRLINATVNEREHWEILGDGEGIHWLDIDEDLSVAGLLKGGQ